MEAPSCPAFQGDKVAPTVLKFERPQHPPQVRRARPDDGVIMAANRLQPEPALASWLDDELRSPRRSSSRPGARSATSGAAPHDSRAAGSATTCETTRRSPCAERASGRSPPRGRRRRAAVFSAAARRDVAEAALIQEEEVEAGKVRCDQGELLAQRNLRQTQRGADGEPDRRDVEQHERAVVASAGEIKTGDEHIDPISNHRQSSARRAQPIATTRRCDGDG